MGLQQRSPTARIHACTVRKVALDDGPMQRVFGANAQVTGVSPTTRSLEAHRQ
jgi:hypothetical protein